MRYKMIFGQTLFSFFKRGRQDLLIKEVRFLNRDTKGNVNGTTRLLYDEDTGRLQRYVSGSAPIASLSDDMVCFLADVSRCFGRITGNESWSEDVWLCVDTETRHELTAEREMPEEDEEAGEAAGFLPFISEPGMGYDAGGLR